MIKTQLGFMAVCACLSTPLLAAGEYTELTASGGVINWTKAAVEAGGFGAAPDDKNPALAPMLACRAAMVDAQRNLLESTKGARVDAETTIDNYVLVSDRVKSVVQGTIKQAKLIEREPQSDGKTCKVVLQAALEGPVVKSIYDDKGRQISWLPTNVLEWFSNISVSLLPQAHAQSEPDNWMTRIEVRINSLENMLYSVGSLDVIARDQKEPTGLVIDARGSQFIPSLSPRVRASEGAILYPSPNDNLEQSTSGRLVSLFASDVDFALKHPRVGERPLLVKATGTYQDTPTDIVISDVAAAATQQLVANDNFAAAGVIIVLD